MRNNGFYLLAVMFFSTPAFAGEPEVEILPSPTRELRTEAAEEFTEGDRMGGMRLLMKAADLARDQDDPYVKSNELRYIADAWAKSDTPVQARKHFAEAMEVANNIPLWNHRLYATIGVVEMQRAADDPKGVQENAMKAVNAGLIEMIAEENGDAAEMGRFFTALDGAITDKERAIIKQRIRAAGDRAFQTKANHALDRIQVKRALF